jgi:hypothetical protein
VQNKRTLKLLVLPESARRSKPFVTGEAMNLIQNSRAKASKVVGNTGFSINIFDPLGAFSNLFDKTLNILFY